MAGAEPLGIALPVEIAAPVRLGGSLPKRIATGEVVSVGASDPLTRPFLTVRLPPAAIEAQRRRGD